MSDMPRPLPCPFCGSDAYTDNVSGTYEVYCDSDRDKAPRCGARIEGFKTERLAVAAWNRRAAAIRGELE